MIYLYKYLINPLFLLMVYIISLFNAKIRSGLRNRRSVNQKLQEWMKGNTTPKPIVHFHTASLGEFEHIKQLISHLKQSYNTTNVVTFFSPSGYENALLNPGMDYKSYVPLESIDSWARFYDILQPKMVVVAKHDVWPGQIWAARNKNIPVYLINASLAETSSRANFVTRKFLRAIYKPITRIFSISEQDKDHFTKAFHLNNVEYLGDTKYDQVVYRKNEAQKTQLLPTAWTSNCKMIVAGSIWPEDAEILLPALLKTLKNNQTWKAILVPHQPTREFIESIKKVFMPLTTELFSNRETLSDEKILIVDAIGYLAGLYNYADIAYVGGSFKQGIHNAMEPAIFGIPVIFGPVHQNSYEAQQLADGNGGFAIHSEREISARLNDFVNNTKLRQEEGQKALRYASSNTGATLKLVNIWKTLLTGKSGENSIS